MNNFGDILVQSSPIFLVMAAPGGTLMMMNDSMLKALGYSLEQVVGEDLVERFVADESRGDARDLFHKCLESGAWASTELGFIARSGKTVPVEWQFQPVYRETGELDFLFGAGLDVTSRKEMESRLRESDQRYRTLFHNNHTPMLLLEPENGGIIDANIAACRFYGYDWEQLTAMRITDINTLPPQEVKRNMVRARSGEHCHFVFQHRVADGSVRDVEIFSGGITISGKSLLYFMVHDVTGRKRMEEELMREREEQSLMFDSVPAMIFYKNKRNRYIRVNRAFAELRDMSRKSIEGATVDEIWPEIAEKCWKDDLEVIETGRPKRGVLHIVETPRGTRWLQTDKVPFRDENGEIIGILGFSTDITEPKGAGEAIQALLESAGDAGEPSLFDRMTGRIRDWLGADIVLIGRFPGPGRMEVMSMQSGGEPRPPFGFSLDDTLFRDMREHGYVCLPEGGGDLCRSIGDIFDCPVEGFAGMAFHDRNGSMAGCVFIMSRRRLLMPNRAEEVLRIFASKAALELERTQSESALRESEAQYRSVVETSPDAIVMFDLDGGIVTANPQFALLLGVETVDQVISTGRTAFDFFAAESRSRAEENFHRLLVDTVTRVSDECTMFRFHGVAFPAEIAVSLVRDSRGAPRAFIAIIRDISERKEAERRLYEEHARLEQRLRNERMFSAVASLMASAETLDTVFDRIACTIRETLALSRVCLLRSVPHGEDFFDAEERTVRFEAGMGKGRRCRDFLRSGCLMDKLRERRPVLLHDLSGLEPEIREMLEADDIRAAALFPLYAGQMAKGLIVFCRDSGHRWGLEEHDLFGILADMIANAIERDDNFQARIEAERRHAEAVQMAERSSRLASVGTLAAGISHEINQPLTALKVKIDSMLYWRELSGTIPQEDLEKDLRFVAQQTERIDDIIKHMRALARQEKSHEPENVDLNLVVGDVLPLLRQRISAHGIQIVQSLDESLPAVRGHRTLLQQVVINLVVNAIHALDDISGGPKVIIITTGSIGADSYLEVVDNGPGIPPEHLGQIFDPFFTTRIGSEGMGLGLSICHNIITGLGGVITVENVSNGGARFLVSIPVAQHGVKRNEHSSRR